MPTVASKPSPDRGPRNVQSGPPAHRRLTYTRNAILRDNTERDAIARIEQAIERSPRVERDARNGGAQE